MTEKGLHVAFYALDYVAPATLDEAIAALAAAGQDAKLLARGQSLIPMLALRLARPAVVVDINRLPGLGAIREGSGTLEVGALVRQRALGRRADRRRCRRPRGSGHLAESSVAVLPAGPPYPSTTHGFSTEQLERVGTTRCVTPSRDADRRPSHAILPRPA